MNTAQRIQSRQKRTSIQDLELPKFWRPKLEPDVQFQAKLTHWDLISRFTDGSANAEDLWDWMETGFTYSQIMRMLTEEEAIQFTDEALNAITEQLLSYEGVAARFSRTGRVGFNSQELLTARAAASVMDGLIEMDRHGIATRAALWSAQEMVKVRAAHAKALQDTARRMLEQSRRSVA
jgi:hypothetical protein